MEFIPKGLPGFVIFYDTGFLSLTALQFQLQIDRIDRQSIRFCQEVKKINRYRPAPGLRQCSTSGAGVI